MSPTPPSPGHPNADRLAYPGEALTPEERESGALAVDPTPGLVATASTHECQTIELCASGTSRRRGARTGG
jgi:hypothetical protein